jgi:hypothetical protein
MMEPDDDSTLVGNQKKAAEDGDGGRKKKKPCKVHTLPLELALLTDLDQDKFDLVLEIDKTHKSTTSGQEFLVAKTVSIPPTNGNSDDPLSPALPVVFICVWSWLKICASYAQILEFQMQGRFQSSIAARPLQSALDTRVPGKFWHKAHVTCVESHKYCVPCCECSFQCQLH